MTLDSTFEFKPFDYNPETGDFTPEAFERYMLDGGLRAALESLVKEPFQEALKASRRESFDFGAVQLKKSEQTRKTTSWKGIYEKLKTFLEIRADDSRAAQLEGLRLVPGVGYCIDLEELEKELADRRKEFTDEISYVQVNGWKRLGRNESITSILVPDRNYSEITLENARVCQDVRKFISALERDCLKQYLAANKKWHVVQTGYDNKEQIPPKDKSPVTRVHLVGRHPVVVKLVREEVPQYEKAIPQLAEELDALKTEGTPAAASYRFKREDGTVLVNIRSVKERLEKLLSEPKIEARYNIDPAYSVN